MNRVLILVDESNLIGTLRQLGKRCDWEGLRKLVIPQMDIDYELLETVVFIGMPPRTEQFHEARKAREKFVTWMREIGYLVITKDGVPTEVGYKSNVDVIMAIKGMSLVSQMKPDTVLLVTHDGDFSHMATELREHGIKVGAVIVGGYASRDLQHAANFSIFMNNWLDSFPDVGQ